MAEDTSKFEAGVEAMRVVAVEKAAAWHLAKWNEQAGLSQSEVHDLINAIIADIGIANIQER